MLVEFDLVPPNAGSMIESLRAFGYDLPTALADLIDNSISAKARNVWVDFIWSGSSSRILLRDDGDGMNEEELVKAMRMGSLNPLEERSEDDMGRFGLGLKTASFSQARNLLVLSKSVGNEVQARCWDLDYIARTAGGEWRLLRCPEHLTSEEARQLEAQDSGTTVILSNLDRVVGTVSENDSAGQRRFRKRIDEVRNHLAMVFHRFLTGKDTLHIHLNGSPVEPWDPFLEGLSDPLPKEALKCGEFRVLVTPFVLPHHSRITAEVHKAAAGPRGWNAQQGFYVYRNRRLIVPGEWLGLGIQKEEHYKLARLRVDLPNSLDHAWHLDVRKAWAYPPWPIRGDMKRIARAVREKAARVYRHRGQVLKQKHASDFVFVWSSRMRDGKTFYKINRKHPLVRSVGSSCALRDRFESMLSMIEQSVPSPLIIVKNSEEPDSLGQPYEDDSKALLKSMEDVFETLLEQGLTVQEAAEKITVMDPFTYHPDVLAAFLDRIVRN